MVRRHGLQDLVLYEQSVEDADTVLCGTRQESDAELCRTGQKTDAVLYAVV